MTINKDSRIGIWGFGVVGKSVADYLYAQGYCHMSIMDKRIPTEQERHYLNEKNIIWYNESDEEFFFNSCEIIVPSPGIYISPTRYATRKTKWVHELDIFYNNFHKPIIAITGSIGKTSTVHILGKLFNTLALPVTVGGNIGIPMLSLLTQQNDVDYALLELSSFQLQHCIEFAPYLAIITNLHPNHLDHHATEDEYFSAKYTMLRHQKNNSLSLIPFVLRSKAPATNCINHLRAYFTCIKPDESELVQLTINERVYYIENNRITRFADSIDTPLMLLTPELLNFSFVDNILLIASVCDMLNITMHALHTVAATTALPEHRVEKIASTHNVDFYNDSKATTTASTLAAVEKLKDRPLHIFIGGLSKGVDRAPFIAQLKNKVKHIYCFGREADALYAMCLNNNIPATQCDTLDDTVRSCLSAIVPGDCVLLSPAGSSYDLYTNYEERGKHFKKLIADYREKNNS